MCNQQGYTHPAISWRPCCQVSSQSPPPLFWHSLVFQRVLTTVQRIFHRSSTFHLKMRHKCPLFLCQPECKISPTCEQTLSQNHSESSTGFKSLQNLTIGMQTIRNLSFPCPPRGQNLFYQQQRSIGINEIMDRSNYLIYTLQCEDIFSLLLCLGESH